MQSLTIITTGTVKEGYLNEAISEYKKRLSAFAKIEEIVLKEERIVNEANRAEIERALAAEGEKILKRIPKDSYKIALCVEGRQYSSEELAAVLKEGSAKDGKLCLIIGSSHGLSPAVNAACDLRLSVSKLTFPHQLMRVMLYEILYRSYSIVAENRIINNILTTILCIFAL